MSLLDEPLELAFSVLIEIEKINGGPFATKVRVAIVEAIRRAIVGDVEIGRRKIKWPDPVKAWPAGVYGKIVDTTLIKPSANKEGKPRGKVRR